MCIRLPVWTLSLGLVLAVAPFSLSAQNGTLMGTLVDADNGVAVLAANVEVLGSSAPVAITSASGQFTISVGPGTYSVLISRIGYRDHRVNLVRIRAGETTTLDHLMVSDALVLDPVVITPGRGPEKSTEAPSMTHVVGETEIAESEGKAASSCVASADGRHPMRWSSRNPSATHWKFWWLGAIRAAMPNDGWNGPRSSSPTLARRMNGFA